MEEILINNKLSLPPNVNGRCRGQFQLCLHEPKWHNKDAISFDGIQIKIVWWGENYYSAGVLKKRCKSATKNCLNYKILTKLKLFKEYLLLSKSIKLKFSSSISNVYIGRATVSIPTDLVKFLDSKTSKVAKFATNCQIYNSQQEAIGDIVVQFQLSLSEGPHSYKSESIAEAILNEDVMCQAEVENNKNKPNFIGNAHSHLSAHKSKAKKKSPIARKRNESDNNTTMLSPANLLVPPIPKSSTKLSIKDFKPSPLMNYLTGQPLLTDEEIVALDAMRSASPTESLMDILSFDLDCLKKPRKQATKVDFSSLNRIDSIRVNICEVNLLKAGVREILHGNGMDRTSFASGTFIVDVKVEAAPSNELTPTKCVHFESKATRIFSSYIDSSNSSIIFNKEAVLTLDRKCVANFDVNRNVSFSLWYRDAASHHSKMLGTTKVSLIDIVKATNYTYKHTHAVRTGTSDIIIGMMALKVELGCRGIHFGADYAELISLGTDFCCRDEIRDRRPLTSCGLRKPQSITCCSCNEYRELYEHDRKIDDIILSTCVYDTHETPANENHGPSSESNSVDSNKSNGQQAVQNSIKKAVGEGSEINQVQNKSESHNRNDEFCDTLNGLFHVGLINFNGIQDTANEVFLVCRPFWSDCVLLTENSSNNVLNYLEQFSLTCDATFLESTKHSFMNIELWQKRSNQSEIIIGSAYVPLHQFFIAYNDVNVRRHVSKQKLPVVSIDGLATIATISATSNSSLGTIQVILAVGSLEQIDNFKRSKNLSPHKSFLRLSPELYRLNSSTNSAIPALPKKNFASENFNKNNIKSAQTNISSERQANLAAMLSNFIDNLATRLPDRTKPSVPAMNNRNATQTANTTSNRSNSSGKYLRPTSELLDELQRALAIAPTPAQESIIPRISSVHQQSEETKPIENTKQPYFNVTIDIESAANLQSIAVRSKKKSGKRGKNNVSNSLGSNTNEIEPSTYVTFEASATSVNATNTVYATNIIENSCNPEWNKHFDVFLPVKLLFDDTHRFVLRIWRKSTHDTSKTHLHPNSSEDVSIGFVSIDMTALMNDVPEVNGWFNIIDLSGVANGEMKIHIKSNEDVNKFREQTTEHLKVDKNEDEVNSKSSLVADEPIVNSLASDISADNSVLSRTLKRKFNELEEITERLRARLFDVTGNMHIDPDDQFESDLNTIPDEEDMDAFMDNDDFDWLQYCRDQYDQQSNNDDPVNELYDFIEPFSSKPNESTQLTNNSNRIEAQAKSDVKKPTAILSGNNITEDDIDEKCVQNIADKLKKSSLED